MRHKTRGFELALRGRLSRDLQAVDATAAVPAGVAGVLEIASLALHPAVFLVDHWKSSRHGWSFYLKRRAISQDKEHQA
jgi:hypothetical protein